MENSKEASQKPKNILLYDPEIPLLGIYPKKKKKTKKFNMKRYTYPNVHSSIIYSRQGMEAT